MRRILPKPSSKTPIMDDDVLSERIERGISLLTAYLSRPPDSGSMDEGLVRAVLGQGVTADDVIAAMRDMLIASELVMLNYQTKTNIAPIEVLREVAAFQQSRE